MFCSIEFALCMCVVSYFIGYFFGRVVKKFVKQKEEKDSMECKTYQDVIDREG